MSFRHLNQGEKANTPVLYHVKGKPTIWRCPANPYPHPGNPDPVTPNANSGSCCFLDPGLLCTTQSAQTHSPKPASSKQPFFFLCLSLSLQEVFSFFQGRGWVPRASARSSMAPVAPPEPRALEVRHFGPEEEEAYVEHFRPWAAAEARGGRGRKRGLNAAEARRLLFFGFNLWEPCGQHFKPLQSSLPGHPARQVLPHSFLGSQKVKLSGVRTHVVTRNFLLDRHLLCCLMLPLCIHA